MEDIRIILGFTWVAVVLLYLYGDMFSVLQGHFKLGEIDGKPLTEVMTLVMATIMSIPIIMIILTVTLDYPLSRWANIIVAVIYILFNLASIRGYPIYEKYTLFLSMIINAVTVIYAWNWIL
ncbi:DUF6326 family protein [Candidatus Hodarchaeum mangrovi]